MKRTLCFTVAAGLVLGACGEQNTTTAPTDNQSLATVKKTYVIALSAGAPSDLATRIERAGGKAKKIFQKARVATAESDAPGFAAQVRALPGVKAVAEDRVVQWVDPDQRVLPASIGDDESFFTQYQWAPRAVHAPEAWDRGARGSGVRVAVLDGGLNYNHIDLDGSVDYDRSASFVPNTQFFQDKDRSDFSHATHVAGIVAARDNAIGTIGIAPGATIIGVKVLDQGTGTFEQVIDGIIYAATSIQDGGAGADIINMSLGATFDPQSADDEALLQALDNTTTFAYEQGVVVIAAAGNDGVNFDKSRNLVTIPAQSAHVIGVSATGPVNFAGGGTNFDRQASYTNFGKAVVDFAGPGGDDTLAPVGQWFLDMVISPGSLKTRDGYFFADGTSMAAPAVAAVAALYLERNPSATPDQVYAKLSSSSDDLGKPGFDAVYGNGRVNAFKAVQ
jgi:subtilisin family serine protease